MLSRALGALIVVALVHAGTLGLTSHAQGATTRASSLLIVAELNPDNPLEARFELRNAVANRVKLQEWRFGDSTSSTEATPTHRYSRPDTYRVSGRYVTADGTELTISRRLNLASPPSVRITGSGSVTGGSSLAFWFAAQATTSRDRTNTRGCRWTFGDGGTASGGKVEHTFPKAGVYKVKVSFEDGAATIVSDAV